MFEWTGACEDRLRALWLRGFTGSEIAREIGAPSRSSVLKKARGLKLPWRRPCAQERITKKPEAEAKAEAKVCRPIAPPPEKPRRRANRPERTKAEYRAMLAEAVRNTVNAA